MKKVFLSVLLGLFTLSMSFAQTAPAKAKTEAKKTVKHEKDKINKDGTPDKRFKDNKGGKNAAAKPVGPLKKDGTADMRYKENKTAKPAAKVTPATKK